MLCLYVPSMLGVQARTTHVIRINAALKFIYSPIAKHISLMFHFNACWRSKKKSSKTQIFARSVRLSWTRIYYTIQTNVLASLKIAVIDTVTFIKQSCGELITLMYWSFLSWNNTSHLFADQARFNVYCFLNLKMLSNYAAMTTRTEKSV